MGEIVALRDKAANVKSYWGATLIFNAVFEKDIGCILQIADRVDGSIPDEKDRERFANIVGNAIDDVMQLTTAEQMTITPNDLAIIAIAKVLVFLSMEPAGKNVQQRKDRQKAIEMVLKRTGGKKTAPVAESTKIHYVDPVWMQSLPQKQEETNIR